MKSFSIGLVIGIFLTILVGIYAREYFIETDTKIVKEEIEDTKWKDKYLKLKLEVSKTKDGNVVIGQDVFDNLIACASSDLYAKSSIEDNVVTVDIGDLCKESKFRIELKTYSKVPRHILQGGYSYSYGIGSGYEVAYLYNFKLFALGGGVVINKTNPGVKAIIQVPIKL